MKRRAFVKSAAIAPFAPARFAIAQPANARTLVFVPQANLTLLDPIFTTAQPTVHHGWAIYDLLFGVTARLEGQRRPGHFDGVATVVLKLFDMVQPDRAVFGRKDAQQCAVIDRMVRDLDIPVRLIFAETIREKDGLAMSSRNSYLTAEERLRAPALHRGLTAGENAITDGIADVGEIEKLMRRIVGESSGVEIDYLEIVDPDTFDRPADFHRDLLVAGAVRLGRTRLIDNIRITRDRLPHARIQAR